MKILEISLKRSPIGRPQKHRRILVSLGLRRINQRVEHSASPQILGMISKVRHLVEWSEKDN